MLVHHIRRLLCSVFVNRSTTVSLALVVAGTLTVGCTLTIQTPTPIPPSEPLVPTPLAANDSPQPALLPTPEGSEVPADAKQPPPLAEPYTLRWRTGVGVPDGKSPLLYDWTEPRPGWYLNWSIGFTETVWITDTEHVQLAFHVPQDEAAGMEFAPMVHTLDGGLQPPPDVIAAAAAQRPGQTWLIGNEPDVRWQDNTLPEAYAESYHLAYQTIKAADPTAKVAIGGLSQITPLRLAWLDRAWAHYANRYGEEMPVDVWNMHAFVLQEQAGGWGVDLPPGVDTDDDAGVSGMKWDIEDHDDLALVEEQVRRMRGWMKEHGQQDKPLWVTEYGILMPASYGFDEERVRAFLLASNDLFANLRDPELGYEKDDNRLVQRWVWFSAGYDLYPTGDLFARDGSPTGLMHALSAYLQEYQ